MCKEPPVNFIIKEGEDKMKLSSLFQKQKSIADYRDMNCFSWYQLEEISLALSQSLNVTSWADPKYNYSQMRQLRKGLENGVNIKEYLNPDIDSHQMYELRLGLEEGLPIELYKDKGLSAEQMHEVRVELKKDKFNQVNKG